MSECLDVGQGERAADGCQRSVRSESEKPFTTESTGEHIPTSREIKAKSPRLKGETWGTRRSGRHVKIKVPWRQKQNSHVSRARRGAPGAREDTSKSKSPGDKSKIPTSQGRDVGHPAIGKTKAKLKSALKTKSKIPTSQRRDVGHPKYIGPSLRSG